MKYLTQVVSFYGKVKQNKWAYIDFTDYPNESCFINRSEDTMIYLNHSTGFIAVALVDNEGTYKIELLDGAFDTPTLKHFVAFLKARGLQPEKYTK